MSQKERETSQTNSANAHKQGICGRGISLSTLSTLSSTHGVLCCAAAVLYSPWERKNKNNRRGGGADPPGAIRRIKIIRTDAGICKSTRKP